MPGGFPNFEMKSAHGDAEHRSRRKRRVSAREQQVKYFASGDGNIFRHITTTMEEMSSN